jgi:hypothetical protein
MAASIGSSSALAAAAVLFRAELLEPAAELLLARDAAGRAVLRATAFLVGRLAAT